MPLSGKGLEKGEGKGKTIMMEVVPRAGETIEEIRRDKNALYLRQEAGLIRLIPWADNMIRISYTKESSFKEEGSPDETAFRRTVFRNGRISGRSGKSGLSLLCFR